VSEVDFNGLRHLSAKMLRRSFPLQDGDLLTTGELDQGVVELSQFGPVERVEARTTPQDPDEATVELHVTEKRRWTVGVGGRWGSERGTEVLFDLRDDSLFGRGVTANLRGIWGDQEKRAGFLLGVPPPPGSKLSYGLVASYEEEDIEPQSVFESVTREERSRVTLETSYALMPGSRVKAYARVSRTHTFELEPIDPDFALDDTFDFLTLGTGYVRDRFDNPFDPRSGYYVGADLSWSTEISEGESEFLRTLLTGSLALEPWTGWTWAQTLRLGLSDPFGGVLPPTTEARFFAGGRASIRGFPLDAVGPVDFFGDPVGGGALLLLNQELRIPLWRMFRFAVFADGGTVWPSWDETDGEISVGAGAGLRVSTPVGLVWGDVAWPVHDPREVGDGVQYYVGIGKTF
jgi:translocation and assembly module TamA